MEKLLVSLIENEGVDVFYVGNNGSFDRIVKRVLKKLKSVYPHIEYFVVLAYMSQGKREELDDYSDTIYPESLAKTPLRFCISKRNKWMIDRAAFVVTYVRYTTGGAAKFKNMAERMGKRVIETAK